MAIGSSKAGVLGAGFAVSAGSVTFNTSSTWTAPVGVKKVSITGSGGAGNAGNTGLYRGATSSGQTKNACGQHGAGRGGGGGAGGGIAPCGGYGFNWANNSGQNNAYQGPQFDNPALGGTVSTGSGNPGQSGGAGQAATTAGTSGTTGPSSAGLGYNFAGGPGGNGGSAAGGGAGGTGGQGGGGASVNAFPFYCAFYKARNQEANSGNTGGAGAGGTGWKSGGSANPRSTPQIYQGGGGGGGHCNPGSAGTQSPNAGGCGGTGNFCAYNNTNVCGPGGQARGNANVTFSRRPGAGGQPGGTSAGLASAGGGGGAGSGYPPNPPGNGNPGQAASSQTTNCVAVNQGGSYPIQVATGGQIKISWNAQ